MILPLTTSLQRNLLRSVVPTKLEAKNGVRAPVQPKGGELLRLPSAQATMTMRYDDKMPKVKSK